MEATVSRAPQKSLAREGLKKAKESGCDVLLVDTAGRMQDNEPLMRALSKLINMNKPNLDFGEKLRLRLL